MRFPLGAVDVSHVGEDGERLPTVASTVVLRQIDGEHWFVSGARSPDIEVTAPTGTREVTSPIAVAGWGPASEGAIVVQLRARTADAEVVAEDVATGGSGASLEPFATELRFDAAPTRVGLVLATDTSDEGSAIPSFAGTVVEIAP